jgi:hypothetical protein
MILLGKFSETIGFGDTLKDNFYKSKKCVEIADNYAIEFAEWIRFNVIEVSQGWQFDGKFYNDEQLLEIFKKEKGL